jgi:hypothetical protein
MHSGTDPVLLLLVTTIGIEPESFRMLGWHANVRNLKEQRLIHILAYFPFLACEIKTSPHLSTFEQLTDFHKV